MTAELTYEHLKGFLEAGAAVVQAYYDYVNSINVFPVPDGDTGSNSSKTLMSAVKAVHDKKPRDLSSLLDVFSPNPIEGYGYSGITLRGFVGGMLSYLRNYLNGNNVIDGAGFVEAVEYGFKRAEKSMSDALRRGGRNIADGTIFSVMRDVTSHIQPYKHKELEEILEACFEKAKESLQQTPKLNPTLLRNRVVDAGGLAFVLMLAGWCSELGLKPQYDMGAIGKADFLADTDPGYHVWAEIYLSNGEVKALTEQVVAIAKESEDEPTQVEELPVEKGAMPLDVKGNKLYGIHVHVERGSLEKLFEIFSSFGGAEKIVPEDMLQQMIEARERAKELKPAGIVSF